MTTEKLEQQLYLQKLRVVRPVRCFRQPFEIEFNSSITLLIGDNGTGKSTILDMIRESYRVRDTSFFKEDLRDYVEVEGTDLPTERVKYFDFHSSDRKFAYFFGEDIPNQVASLHMSSAEGLVKQLEGTGISNAKNSLIILDEVARGSSIRLQIIYAMILSKLALKNQVIASTNEYLTMRFLLNDPSCRFYSIEDKRYVDLDEFLSQQMNLRTILEH